MQPKREIFAGTFQQALAVQRRKDGALDRLLQEAERLGVAVETPAPVQCQICCDKGVITYAINDHTDPRFGKFFPCPNPTCPTRNANLEARYRELVKSAHIPDLYDGFTFETWWEAAKHRPKNDNWFFNSAREWVTSPGHALTISGQWLDGGKDATRSGLIFSGDNGVGKTGLMVAMAHALMKLGEQAVYIRAMDYMALKYRTYRSGATEKDDAVVEAIQTAPILLLDDFNVENGTENKQDVMEDLVRFRHGHMLPIVATCNYSKDQLTALWGKRAMSALLEVCHWIQCGGEPLRDTRQIGGAR